AAQNLDRRLISREAPVLRRCDERSYFIDADLLGKGCRVETRGKVVVSVHSEGVARASLFPPPRGKKRDCAPRGAGIRRPCACSLYASSTEQFHARGVAPAFAASASRCALVQSLRCSSGRARRP